MPSLKTITGLLGVLSFSAVVFQGAGGRAAAAAEAMTLPQGVKAVWDMAKAERESTPSRERICVNGLFRWQPAEDARVEQVPEKQWGYFKVPGCWPGITDYLQKDCQAVFAHPSWKSNELGRITAAWYEREITVPPQWAGRRVSLQAEFVNSFAAVFVDGKKAGEISFPGGEIDLTTVCRPGVMHRLSLLVVALPLKAVMLSYTDSASAREIKGNVARRGLCGDLYLTSRPRGPQLADVKVETSVRRGELTCLAQLAEAAANGVYRLRTRATPRGGRPVEFTSSAVGRGEWALAGGQLSLTAPWRPAGLWDLHTPQNTFDLELALLDETGRVLDVYWRVRTGFREFWIEGRDFKMNGTRLGLSAVPLDNAEVGAAWAGYAAARESFERLQSFGINYVYTHNYGCEPGAHLGFEEVLRAADDTGMLVGFSQPHFSHYGWDGAAADRTNGYARHAAYYVRAAQNHPSVVMYAMSHNATGYDEDMNPDLIDGIQAVRDRWGQRNVTNALRAEAIVRGLDPSRVIYHHASGNLGSMHDSNFYPNFVPVQELSDWFEHWATVGVKPFFTCEYGAPFTWDWMMYRGWYGGQREFGSARVPWEFCLAEWNAQFFGDKSYALSEAEKSNLRWEARQFRAGALWHRWDYPVPPGSTRLEACYPVLALYLEDNWRAYRTWGVSGISPWEHAAFWKVRAGVDRSRKALPVDWDSLQRPGFSADYLAQRFERMDLAFERSDWIPTAAAQALLRNNRPLLAYLGGGPGRFTGKDHNFLPGEAVDKQVILINNSRERVECESEWTLRLPSAAMTGGQRMTVNAGQQERVPLHLALPASLATGRYGLELTARFSNGETQADRVVIDVLAPPSPPPDPRALEPIAVFDPRGETTAWLKKAGFRLAEIGSDADLSPFNLVVVGRRALSLDGPAPDLGRVRAGLKVVIFEQTADVLEKRLGLRVAEYGLRQVFPRVPDHPVLAGLAADHLHDWRGEATLHEPRLKYQLRPRYGPTIEWCGLPVTRAWRCGNRGNVASVSIEKPARGDFLPIVDGGYSLQYSPLLEYHEGQGLILFCQLDVTGRTQRDPVAERLAVNLLHYASAWHPRPVCEIVYAGESAGRKHLQAAGFAPAAYEGRPPGAGQLLVVGPGGGEAVAGQRAAIAGWLKAGGVLAAVGLDQAQLDAFLPFPVRMKRQEHISTLFNPPGSNSPFAGIGPADCHNRDPRELSVASSAGAGLLGDGVLASVEGTNVALCQLVPWQFEGELSNLRRTRRRASFLLTRLLANLGATSSTPLLERIHAPLDPARQEARWRDGFYLDQPVEWDDPYRFFRW